MKVRLKTGDLVVPTSNNKSKLLVFYNVGVNKKGSAMHLAFCNLQKTLCLIGDLKSQLVKTHVLKFISNFIQMSDHFQLIKGHLLA